MDLLTKADVARRLNVTPQTVRNLVDRGELRAIRTERGWRLFRLQDGRAPCGAASQDREVRPRLP